MSKVLVPKRRREYRHVPMTHPKQWQVPRPREDFIIAARMDARGKSHAAIGKAFNVSRQRASVMVAKGRVLMRGEQLDLLNSQEGAVSVLNPEGTEETGDDRPAAPVSTSHNRE